MYIFYFSVALRHADVPNAHFVVSALRGQNPDQDGEPGSYPADTDLDQPCRSHIAFYDVTNSTPGDSCLCKYSAVSL